METAIQPPSTALRALFTISHRGISEPLDCSTPILDLCVRRRNRSPTPDAESRDSQMHHPPIYTEIPTSTMVVSSPGSQAGSETSETSTSSDLYRDSHARAAQTTLTTKVKVPRPFKAYPKDPLSLTAGVTVAECVIGKDSAEAYTEFRKRMLAQVQATHGVTNKNMRRTSQSCNGHNRDDLSYWEKRRKNNEAAKRSRDARRAKEDEIAIRAAFLEQENLKLRYEVAALRNEMEKLRSLLYSHPVV